MLWGELWYDQHSLKTLFRFSESVLHIQLRKQSTSGTTTDATCCFIKTSLLKNKRPSSKNTQRLLALYQRITCWTPKTALHITNINGITPDVMLSAFMIMFHSGGHPTKTTWLLTLGLLCVTHYETLAPQTFPAWTLAVSLGYETRFSISTGKCTPSISKSLTCDR